jgi:hypothetical protein
MVVGNEDSMPTSSRANPAKAWQDFGAMGGANEKAARRRLSIVRSSRALRP